MDNLCGNGDDLDLRSEMGRLREGSREAAYLFRLCCIGLMLAGHRPGAIGGCLAISERTLSRWMELYRRSGTAGVRRGLRLGRPCRLGEPELAALLHGFRLAPWETGLDSPAWNGPLAQRLIEDRCGVRLGIRQCQRLLSSARREPQEQPLAGRRSADSDDRARTA